MLFSADVTQQVGGDPPVTRLVELAQPERAGIGEAGPAAQPRVAGDQEVIARHVKHVQPDAERLPLDVVDLRVGQRPMSRRGVPVLAYPVILIPSGAEVPAEAAPGPRRDTVCPQHGHGQDGEVAAVAGHPRGRLPCHIQRPAVLADDLVK
jgi:hypothetical protein